MKKGDKVVIDDGSFSRTIRDNKLVHGPGGDRGDNRSQYIIIETGCSFPNTDSSNSFNNTVIQAVDSGKVIFIEERFLRPVLPKHTIMIDVECKNCAVVGTWIEISDKLYKEIKRL